MPNQTEDFFDTYMEFVQDMTDAPRLYHMWCAISGITAMIGNRAWFVRGHFEVFPNFYVMLLGGPGTGKGTAIGILQNLLAEAGYDTLAADRSSKEKFLADFDTGFSFAQSDEAEILDNARHTLDIAQLLGDAANDGSREVFIVAEEFNDFLGPNPSDFVILLTKLWSYRGTYKYRLKNSRSVRIPNPCVNILAGNTPSNFSLAFPPEIMGSGFLARLLCVHGEPTGRKTSFPKLPNRAVKTKLVSSLTRIRDSFRGEKTAADDAMLLLDRINQEWVPLPDGRFQHYTTRRFTHLLKLGLVFCAARFGRTISEYDVRRANTVLSYTENLMPRAIGEFGKSKNSDTATKIVEIINNAQRPILPFELFKLVATDVTEMADLAKILQHLLMQEKIMNAPSGKGYIPRMGLRRQSSEFIDAEEERKLIG